VAIDYLTLHATGTADRLEVTVTEHVRDELERGRTLEAPVLIDAAESAEVVFRRGAEALAFCEEQQVPALHLVSTRSALPHHTGAGTVIAISAWPLELDRLEELFETVDRMRWGVAVPLLYPVTTDLDALGELAAAAAKHGAAFLASLPLEVEATARRAIAGAMQLSGDDDRYALLFHSDVEPIHLATERHLAALAAEHGLADFILPPRWEERSNWNAAVLLTLTASRMFAMELDLDLAGLIARSARVVSELDKPLVRIAESANLSIIEALDETSVAMLSEWLETGSASFADHVCGQWRLRRDQVT
jgi:hypothetical protein